MAKADPDVEAILEGVVLTTIKKGSCSKAGASKLTRD